MQIITLQAIPNQKLSVPIGENQWDISIKDTNGTVSFTMALNGVVIVSNTRAVAGGPILPYKYEESGNFTIITRDYEIPDYTKFNITQWLVYASQDELDDIRAGNPDFMTVADFDPNGGLPLRFKPQGYISG